MNQHRSTSSPQPAGLGVGGASGGLQAPAPAQRGPAAPRGHGFKRRAIAAGIALAGLSATAAAQQADDAVEEIVVTGSYIRGTPLDAPSPVQVIGSAEIEAQGAAILWDVVKNLEVNSGSFNHSAAAGNRSQIDGTAHVNLRNLGENSTLTLVNGKRMAPAAGITNNSGEFVNVNDFPVLMTNRIEILTDGGSALYGADAVAGVVNIITRNDFEGVELYADIQNVENAGSNYEKTFSGIWGWSSDSGDTHFVVAGDVYTKDPITADKGNHYDANTEYLATVQSLTSDLIVATSSVFPNLNMDYVNAGITALRNMERAADGDPAISTPVYSDPLCETLNSLDGTPFQWGSLRENRGERGGTCREDVTEYNFLARDTERTTISAAFDHTFNEAAEFYSFVNYSENKIVVEGGGINNTGGSSNARGPTFFLAQPGAHNRLSFNQLRALNLIDEATLMAIPMPFRNTPFSAGATIELGYFADRIGLTRPTDIPNAPVAMANGGINVAFGSTIRDGIPRDGKRSNTTETNSMLVQTGLRGDFTVNERPWNYDVSLSWSQTGNEQQYQTFDRFRAELAANGLGGPNCRPDGVIDFDFINAPNMDLSAFGVPDALSSQIFASAWPGALGNGVVQTFFPGYVLTTREAMSLALTSTNHGRDGCMFYNPFLTSITNPDVANNPELTEWMNLDVFRADKRNTLAVFDAVVSGEMFDMAGGTAAFAFGGQYRERTTDSRAPHLNFPGIDLGGYRRLHPVDPEQGPGEAILGYDASGVPDEFHYVSNNFECSSCIFNFNHERTVSAVFTEFSLPFAEGWDAQIAARWEDYGGNIGAQVSPKVAFSWRPSDDLLLRASWSESFRAPNIDIVEQGLEANSIVFRDPISNPMVRAGLLPATPENGEVEQTFTLGAPAPDVGNEYADTYNFGVIWEPAGALDGFRAQFDFWRFEVSDRVLPQPGISAVQPEIALFNAAVGNPDNYILNDSIGIDGSRIFYNDGSLIRESDDESVAAMRGGDTGQDVPCNPNEFDTLYGRDSDERLNCVVNPELYRVEGGGISRSVRTEVADLITLQLAAINAGEIEADGADVKLSYAWESDHGSFSLGIDYTWVRKYELLNVPGLEQGLLSTGVFDAAGTSGNNNHVYSLPDNKGYITFNWQRGPHGLTLVNRHVGSYADLAYDFEYENANDFERSLLRKEIDSYSTWDLQYRHHLDWENTRLGSTQFTIGVLDLLNEDLPYRETGGLNYDATVFDPRGRRLYARILWQFE